MNRTYLLIAVLVLGAWGVRSALAVSYIEPTSPDGGTSAAPLNGSGTTQRKLGSLIIGSSTSPSYLCLNSDTVTTDPATCISSWSQLHGNYVTLSEKAIPPGGTLSDYTVNGGPADSGFARIQADTSLNQLYSLIVEAPDFGGSTATGLYASDSGSNTNYAAEFNGAVYVGDGTAGSAKKFCLNGLGALDTNSSSPTYGKGCIRSWSDLAAFMPSQNFVLLQSPAQAPNPQYGNIAVTGSAVVATDASAGLVIGAPVAGTSATITCGDGMCNGTENGIAGSGANYCAVDCDRTAPAEVVMGTIQNGLSPQTITFNWTNPGTVDFAGVKIIRTIGNPPTSPTMTTTTGADAVYVVRKTDVPNNKHTEQGLQTNIYYYYTFYTYDITGNYSSGVTVSEIYPNCTAGPNGRFQCEPIPTL